MVTTQVTNRCNSSTVEHRPYKSFVVGSNPIRSTNEVHVSLKPEGSGSKAKRFKNMQASQMKDGKVWEGDTFKILAMQLGFYLHRSVQASCCGRISYDF